MIWFKRKELCRHCQNEKTRRKFEGQATCGNCKIKILGDREGIRHCPVDNTALIKEVRNEILIDQCPRCQGVWLDAGEIDAIREAGKNEGLAIGMAVS